MERKKSLDIIPVFGILVFTKDLAIKWRFFFSLSSSLLFLIKAFSISHVLFMWDNKTGFSLSSIFCQMFALFKASTMPF